MQAVKEPSRDAVGGVATGGRIGRGFARGKQGAPIGGCFQDGVNINSHGLKALKTIVIIVLTAEKPCDFRGLPAPFARFPTAWGKPGKVQCYP
jgi:hypothetical protein